MSDEELRMVNEIVVKRDQAVGQERERCAKLLEVEAIRLEGWPRHVLWPEGAPYLRSLAAAIRARGGQ